MFAAGTVLCVILHPFFSSLLQEHCKVFSFSVCEIIRVYWILYIYEYNQPFLLLLAGKKRVSTLRIIRHLILLEASVLFYGFYKKLGEFLP